MSTRRTAATVLLFLLLFPICSYSKQTIPQPSPQGYVSPSRGDFSDLSWHAAFVALHTKLQREYAFSHHKKINWPKLKETFEPRFIHAEKEHNLRLYGLALREYLFSIPDGHLDFDPYDEGEFIQNHLRWEAIGGGYDFALTPLDDGRVIAHIVLEGGQASQAGMKRSAEILTWNGKPIQQAIEEQPLLWNSSPIPTAEHRKLEKARFLTRGPVDSQVTVSFKNPGSTETVKATLTAVEDDEVLLQRSAIASIPESVFDWMGREVETKRLRSGEGYIKILSFIDFENLYKLAAEVQQSGKKLVEDDDYERFSVLSERLIKKFRDAMVKFSKKNVPAIIIDLRGSRGGRDVVVTGMLGHFFTRKTFYQRGVRYNAHPLVEEWELDSFDKDRWIYPRKPHYSGPIIVLSNAMNVSAGEGMAHMLQTLENVTVIGFHGSNGSFGAPGSTVIMPEGYAITYSASRAVNESLQVMIEADGNGQGGVVPDIKIPRTEDSVILKEGGKDVELHFALKYLKEEVYNPNSSPSKSKKGSSKKKQLLTQLDQ